MYVGESDANEEIPAVKRIGKECGRGNGPACSLSGKKSGGGGDLVYKLRKLNKACVCATNYMYTIRSFVTRPLAPF